MLDESVDPVVVKRSSVAGGFLGIVACKMLTEGLYRCVMNLPFLASAHKLQAENNIY